MVRFPLHIEWLADDSMARDSGLDAGRSVLMDHERITFGVVWVHERDMDFIALLGIIEHLKASRRGTCAPRTPILRIPI